MAAHSRRLRARRLQRSEQQAPACPASHAYMPPPAHAGLPRPSRRSKAVATHQHKALAHLVVVQEGLVALVDGAGHHLASARGARASAARVGQVNPCSPSRAGCGRVSAQQSHRAMSGEQAGTMTGRGVGAPATRHHAAPHAMLPSSTLPQPHTSWQHHAPARIADADTELSLPWHILTATGAAAPEAARN